MAPAAILLLLALAAPAAASQPDCAAAVRRAAERLDQVPAPRRDRAQALVRSAEALAAVGVEDGCWDALAEARIPEPDAITQALDSISVADPPQQPAAAAERQQGDLR